MSEHHVLYLGSPDRKGRHGTEICEDCGHRVERKWCDPCRKYVRNLKIHNVSKWHLYWITKRPS